MDEQEKQSYLKKYKEDKEKGVPFFPDIIFKDTVVSLLVFIILVSLAYFVGVPTEARANPNDTTYTPRPEWYFLFLFQLLKYFPGKLEFIGAMVIPGLALVLMLVLPFIDRSPKRHFLNRPIASLAGLAGIAGILTLTVLALLETPPPQEAVIVDKAATLYAQNCANCHGPSIDVPPGVDLHKVIAQGSHDEMPAWGGDLSTDEIDLLAGFISSPNGSAIYTRECADCHKDSIKATGNPQEIDLVLEQGAAYPPHADADIPNWNQTLSQAEKNALKNFLAAPDGQRLFAINCSGCHGYGVAFTGTESELRQLISKGGQHLDMPAWRGTLTASELDTLASYVTFPASTPAGEALFDKHCSSCHGDKVPAAPDKEAALKIISAGGAHMTMPVWGDILTPEQLDALVRYTIEASKGTGPEAGAQLFAENCATCHGDFGEGGQNPTRANDTIAPISSSEYLKTRDDLTLRNIISQGQPDFGMSPFGDTNGGPLTADQIDAIVAFIRAWEANPPVVSAPPTPTETATPQPQTSPLTGPEIYAKLCAQCHGPNGEGGSASAINTQEVQERYDNSALTDLLTNGRSDTPMLAWGELFTPEQIQALVGYVRILQLGSGNTSGETVSFSGQVLPILQENCSRCHSATQSLGGWDASSYQSVTTTGSNAPVVTPSDPGNSLLLLRLLGIGNLMPPDGQLSFSDLQTIFSWILSGAPDN